jgi:hypothetical protein
MLLGWPADRRRLFIWAQPRKGEAMEFYDRHPRFRTITVGIWVLSSSFVPTGPRVIARRSFCSSSALLWDFEIKIECLANS